jgi:hypothetical protein
MASGKTLDQDVTLLGQALQNKSPCVVLEIQGNALFASVQVEERGTLLRVRRLVHEGTSTPRDIPSAGRLDLNHLGTQSGQELRTEGASDILAEVENAYIS